MHKKLSFVLLILSISLIGCSKDNKPIDTTIDIIDEKEASNIQDLLRNSAVEVFDNPLDYIDTQVYLEGEYSRNINPLTGEDENMIISIDKDGLPVATYFHTKDDLPLPIEESGNPDISYIELLGTLTTETNGYISILVLNNAKIQ